MQTAEITRDNLDQDSDVIKQKIIEAASYLFEKKGLYETSVAEVAEAAGVSAPVTYHYLTRKSDIMLLIMEHFTDQFKARVLPKINSMTDVNQKLLKATEVFFQLVEENRLKVVLVYRESRTLDQQGRSRIMAAEIAHQKIFKEILDEGVQQGIYDIPDTDLMAYNIIMAGHTWALKNWHFKKRFNLSIFLKRQLGYIMNTISVRPEN